MTTEEEGDVLAKEVMTGVAEHFVVGFTQQVITISVALSYWSAKGLDDCRAHRAVMEIADNLSESGLILMGVVETLGDLHVWKKHCGSLTIAEKASTRAELIDKCSTQDSALYRLLEAYGVTTLSAEEKQQVN